MTGMGYDQAVKSREKYVHDQGIEQGIKQGVEQGRQDIARTMLARGLTPTDVADLTGLTTEQISALSSENRG